MECCGPGYASPTEAMKAPRENLLYTIAIYTGTGIQKPDYLCTIDANPESQTYSKVISRLEMPGIGDELHHMGWNACSSCHNVMVSSEWAAPNTFMPGFDLEEVGHLKYGREIHFWDFKKKYPYKQCIWEKMALFHLRCDFTTIQIAPTDL